MNRAIMFRGKSKRTNEWIHGELLRDMDNHAIVTDVNIHDDNNIIAVMRGQVVFSDTVGQYTGLKDINGEHIYEGDTIDFEINYYEMTGGNKSDEVRKEVVKYENGTYWAGGWTLLELVEMRREIEVIGNVHDNLELLE